MTIFEIKQKKTQQFFVRSTKVLESMCFKPTIIWKMVMQKRKFNYSSNATQNKVENE